MNRISGFLAIAGLVGIVFAAGAEAGLVSVSANPLWTNTGLELNGETLTVYGATGRWFWQEETDADGTSVGSSFLYDEWIQNGRHGQLIGYVGDLDPNSMPRVIAQDTPELFAVGTGSVTKSGLIGHLWLGINDDYSTNNFGDNTGTITALVDVAPVPVPASAWLMFTGLASFMGLRRKRRP